MCSADLAITLQRMRDTASGRVRSLKRPVITSQPSVQGVWDPSMTFESFSMRESTVEPPAALPLSATELAAAASELNFAARRVEGAAARVKLAERVEKRTAASSASAAAPAPLPAEAGPVAATAVAALPRVVRRAKGTASRRRRTLARYQAALERLTPASA